MVPFSGTSGTESSYAPPFCPAPISLYVFAASLFASSVSFAAASNIDPSCFGIGGPDSIAGTSGTISPFGRTFILMY